MKAVIEEREVSGQLLEGKKCTGCLCWYPLGSGFHKSKHGLGGVLSKCKECVRKHALSKRDETNKTRREWYAKNKVKARGYHEKTIMRHRERYENYWTDWREDNPTHLKEWREANPEKVRVIAQRRRARERGFPSTLTDGEWKTVLDAFENSCALSGNPSNVELDHVLPLGKSDAGTVLGNVIPLNNSLNASKRDKHLFVWFDEVEEKFGLCRRKFNETIAHLAKVNDMTPEEYRNYYYTEYERGEKNIAREAQHTI